MWGQNTPLHGASLLGWLLILKAGRLRHAGRDRPLHLRLPQRVPPECSHPRLSRTLTGPRHACRTQPPVRHADDRVEALRDLGARCARRCTEAGGIRFETIQRRVSRWRPCPSGPNWSKLARISGGSLVRPMSTDLRDLLERRSPGASLKGTDTRIWAPTRHFGRARSHPQSGPSRGIWGET